MTEEKKEDKKPEVKAEVKTEVKAEVKQEVKAEAKKEEVKKEKPSTCASCSKSIKNKRWYYRNSKFYCSKRCWQAASKKEKAPEAPVAPQA